ncbi:MAG: succinate--CoA ligase subunit beta [Alphaproteobacteria bacterium]|nr:succinate--CoA ligase subunit beta [Alphaproteobacteria bacterium]
MQIQEYQIKKIFSKAGIPILKGAVAYTPNEAYEVAKRLNCPRYIVKAQIPTYLRGKGEFVEADQKKKSGLRKTSSLKAVKKETAAMLFKHLKTPLTGDKAFEVKKVYIEEIRESADRYKLAIYIDFETQKVFLTAQNLLTNTKKIFKTEVNLNKETLPLSKATQIATKLGLQHGLQKKMVKILQSLYEVFVTYQAFEVNIDPLILTPDKKFFAMAGKIAFDPDVAVSDKNIACMSDLEEETPNETRARLNNFRYTKLDGNIGCIINGSGLGMATLDLFRLHGGKPACLLDIGGEPTKEIMAAAFKAVLSEPDVEGVFINIFGGTTRCDVIAEGLVAAAKEISVGIPIVVRIDGTNEQIATRVLFESGLPFIVKKGMDEAVCVIIHAVQEIM